MKTEYNNKLLNIISLLILILIPLFQIISLYFKKYGILQNPYSINASIVFYISLPILIYVYISNIIIKKRKLDKFDYVGLILIVTSIITTIFSIDPMLSIFGNTLRREGMLSIITYYMVFLNWKNNEEKENNILKVIYIIAIINIIYSLLQVYTNLSFILRFEPGSNMASGLLGNPNFLGSFIVTLLCMDCAKFLIKKNITKKEIFMLIGLFLTLFLAQSTGPLVALVLTILFMIIKLLKEKRTSFKKIFILFSICILTYTAFYFVHISISSKKCELCSINETIDSGFTGRLRLWENTLKYNVRDYWLTGTGFENFKKVYPNKTLQDILEEKENQTDKTKPIKDLLEEKVNTSDGTVSYLIRVYDKAHNVYLNTLADAGIINLIPYLILCLLVFIVGLKLKSEIGIILLSGFIGYSIQAFGNISVIQVAPIYYIIMGMIVSEYKKQQNL